MVKDVAVIGPDEDLIKAVEKMRSSSDGIINQLVVMEGNKMTGIISDGDIIKALRF